MELKEYTFELHERTTQIIYGLALTCDVSPSRALEMLLLANNNRRSKEEWEVWRRIAEAAPQAAQYEEEKGGEDLDYGEEAAIADLPIEDFTMAFETTIVWPWPRAAGDTITVLDATSEIMLES
ncbi:hypothetical protein GO986_11995 [Deinococcus sp. HMF7620]|uniref:Uncharacterized protein n=1 Tax=Deinococcus arboris TaxID=2682977 RepID=A0A7C9IBM2_9DEIO|nr:MULTISPECIES: hypothetical protein [Deinococcus]MBZ9752162.1 hypothetical protein [Deinococcus betulae]MVN87486.1 hypothetical protein [Deinococcus arboris]